MFTLKMSVHTIQPVSFGYYVTVELTLSGLTETKTAIQFRDFTMCSSWGTIAYPNGERGLREQFYAGDYDKSSLQAAINRIYNEIQAEFSLACEEIEKEKETLASVKRLSRVVVVS